MVAKVELELERTEVEMRVWKKYKQRCESEGRGRSRVVGIIVRLDAGHFQGVRLGGIDDRRRPQAWARQVRWALIGMRLFRQRQIWTLPALQLAVGSIASAAGRFRKRQQARVHVQHLRGDRDTSGLAVNEDRKGRRNIYWVALIGRGAMAARWAHRSIRERVRYRYTTGAHILRADQILSGSGTL